MNRAYAAAPFVLSLIVSACGADDPGKAPPTVGAKALPVVNGVPDLGSADEAVVFLQWINASGSGTTCTGTAISPHLVVTARHCVSPYDDSTGKFGADLPT